MSLFKTLSSMDSTDALDDESSFQLFHQPEDNSSNILPTDLHTQNSCHSYNLSTRSESTALAEDTGDDEDTTDSVELGIEGGTLSDEEQVEVAAHLHNWRICHAKGEYKLKGKYMCSSSVRYANGLRK
jgi:hypothetical protein